MHRPILCYWNFYNLEMFRCNIKTTCVNLHNARNVNIHYKQEKDKHEIHSEVIMSLAIRSHHRIPHSISRNAANWTVERWHGYASVMPRSRTSQYFLTVENSNKLFLFLPFSTNSPINESTTTRVLLSKIGKNLHASNGWWQSQVIYFLISTLIGIQW